MLNVETLKKDQYLLYAWHRKDSKEEIKIGKSTVGRLYGRLVSAQTENPYKIQFLGVILVDAETTYEMNEFETRILRQFNKIRTEGEWVYADEEVWDWVKTDLISVPLDDFKVFHRERTRQLRKNPMFVERERKQTKDRRAKQKAARENPTEEISVEAAANNSRSNRASSGMFKERKKKNNS